MTTDTGMVEQLEVVALVKLAQLNVPTDVQELLVQGNPMAGVAPHALRSAIVSVLECLRTPTPEMVEAGTQETKRGHMFAQEMALATYLAFIDAACDHEVKNEPV